MSKKYEKMLKDLLKDFAFITVDFGMGEIISDPMYKSILDIDKEDETWDTV